MNKRRAQVAAVVAGVLVAVSGVVAVDRASEALLGSGFLWPKPSIPDILDGRVANAERLQALTAVDAFSVGLGSAHTAVIGRVEFTTCIEGQHNWKTRDPYRLVCSAYVASYRAWSGEFDSVAGAVRSELASTCSDSPAAAPIGHPAPNEPTLAESYECGSGLTANLVFASSSGLTSSDGSVKQEPSRYIRYVVRPGPDELVQSLKNYDWFAVVEIGEVFYRD